METEKIKQLLEAEKEKLEKELETVATKDKNMEGNWNAKRMNMEDSDMEEKADEVEEYDNRVSLEQSLEVKLLDVNAALAKIAGEKYGVCEKCGKEISTERLMVNPAAKLCVECN